MNEIKEAYDFKHNFESVRESIKTSSTLTPKNTAFIFDYLNDLEQGRNLSGSRKGARAYSNISAKKSKLFVLSSFLEQRGIKEISRLKDDKALIDVLNDMRAGKLKRYKKSKTKACYNENAVSDYAKAFASFWHWHIIKNKKKGIIIPDITTDLDKTRTENSFVYFSFEELKKLMPYFNEDEQVMLLFMFDSVIRSPKELMNVKVSDLHDDSPMQLSIREETSKTFGRTIKLMLCSNELKKYIKRKELKPENFLFDFNHSSFNKKLKQVAQQVFGDVMTKGGKRFNEISMYDFRHSGACYWRLGAYKTKIDALMYRGGWNNLNILNYYTKKLGMRDSIERGDLLAEEDKSKVFELEQKLAEQQQEIAKIQKMLLKVINKGKETLMMVDEEV